MHHTTNLSNHHSIVQQFVSELRDVNVQLDQMRFRKNLERIGEILAYEISKTLEYEEVIVETPFGEATTVALHTQPVLATILRAGLPMHQGMLNFFDKAGNAFVSAYRRHHKDGSFEINVEYVSCPSLADRPLIICDPMLATGASMEKAIRELIKHGVPSSIHIATAICAAEGIEYIRQSFPYAHIWTCAIDEELTAKSYIVPGLGDAGDLAYGSKRQE